MRQSSAVWFGSTLGFADYRVRKYRSGNLTEGVETYPTKKSRNCERLEVSPLTVVSGLEGEETGFVGFSKPDVDLNLASVIAEVASIGWGRSLEGLKRTGR